MYLTPAQFRAMNLGVPNLDTMKDSQLAAILRRASADVDSHCAVPLIPQKHSFAGGTITDETHTWYLDPYATHLTRRVYPYHTPVLEVTSFRVQVTLDQYVEFDEDKIYFEASEGWLEPVDLSLTSYGLFGVSILPFVGLTQPHSKISYTYGYREQISEWLVKDIDADIWRASRGYWIEDTVELTVDGTPRTADLTIDLVEGTVTFDADPPADEDVRVEINVVSSLPYDIAEATGLIAAAKMYDRSWATRGWGGLRSVAVAEVRVERDTARNQSSESRALVPPEAADILTGYVFTTIR